MVLATRSRLKEQSSVERPTFELFLFDRRLCDRTFIRVRGEHVRTHWIYRNPEAKQGLASMSSSTWCGYHIDYVRVTLFDAWTESSISWLTRVITHESSHCKQLQLNFIVNWLESPIHGVVEVIEKICGSNFVVNASKTFKLCPSW